MKRVIILMSAITLFGCGGITVENFPDRLSAAKVNAANAELIAAGDGRRLALAAVASTGGAISAPKVAADQLFDWAEMTFPAFFPTSERSQQWQSYKYRYYKDTDLYIAIESDLNVIALGKPTGNLVLNLGSLQDFASKIFNLSDPIVTMRSRWTGSVRQDLRTRYLFQDPMDRFLSLQGMSSGQRSELCNPSWSLGIPAQMPLLRPLIKFDQANDLFNIPQSLDYAAGQDINFYLARQSGAYLYHASLWMRDGDWRAGYRVVSSMREWIDSDALSIVKPSPGSCFMCYRHALSFLHAIDVLRTHSAVDETFLLKAFEWLEKFLRKIYIFQELPDGSAGADNIEQKYNNHNGIRNQLLMSWAILVNDYESFQKAIDLGYKRSLETVRDDGSLLWDSQRGNWAIWYSNFMAGNLVGMAEMAMNQGVDLYSIKNSRQKTLQDSVDFLMNSIENFELINIYAKNNITNGGGAYTGIQDLRPFSQRMAEWDLWSSWLERYKVRFPEKTAVDRVLKLSVRPRVSETDGLASCLSGRF